MVLDRVQKDVLTKVAKSHDLTYKEVEEIYLSAFKFVRDVANGLDLKSQESNVDIRALKSNCNMPRLGKFYLNVPKIMAVKGRINNK